MYEFDPAVQACAVNAMALCRVDGTLELLSVQNAPMHVGTTVEHPFTIPGSFAYAAACNTPRDAPYIPFAVDFTVSVTWTGKFTANGYAPGRLSARVYREPLSSSDDGSGPSLPSLRFQVGDADSALVRVPVGYMVVSSVQLCSLTTMGSLVIRSVVDE